MALKRIRLELARTPEAPEGDSGCGYEFTAPLDYKGRIDPKGWAREKSQCDARRFWHRSIDERGSLVHHRGNQWAFAWRGSDSEEPIHRFDRHAFKVGEYVSVTEHDGVLRPFRVVAVDPLHESAAP
jgi:hypothetical protein